MEDGSGSGPAPPFADDGGSLFHLESAVEGGRTVVAGEDFLLDLNASPLENSLSENASPPPENSLCENSSQLDAVVVPVTPVPLVGMSFSTWDELDGFLRKYGRQQGFGVVRRSAGVKKPKGTTTTIFRNYTWRCECHGEVDTRRRLNGREAAVGPKGVQLVTRKSKKCGCPVKIYATVSSDDRWVIKTVILKHENHQPNPKDSRFISQYRQQEITPRVRKFIENGDAVGIPLPQLYRALAKEMNGLENMGLRQRDLRNMLAKGKKLKLESGDATAMLEYFKRMSKDNNMFFHMERYDEFERLKDVMWVDARSRAAYKEFGDVVTFDSTYITNKFHLPFANFVGVNHHGQSILLGCALVSREDSETYEWVFSTWLECMGGVKPAGILTDQCAAMRKALKIVMPETRHRWCLWHILQKLPDKLKGYEDYDVIKEDLLSAIYDSFTPDDFNLNWEAVIQYHHLQDNEWLAGLFKESDMWAPTHLKHMFWAGMMTTQRSESVNSFFKGYVKKHTRLYEFAEQYFRAMEARVDAEQEADADSSRNPQRLVLYNCFEMAFQKIYTNGIFKKLQEECMKLTYVNLLERKSGGENIIEHVLEDRIWIRCKSAKKYIPTLNTREYFVSFHTVTKEAWCVCKYFESHGIMCRHLLLVYEIQKVKEVPQKFILNRWRKDVKRQHNLVKVAYHDPSKTEEGKRFDKMMDAFESLCLQASSSEEKVAIVLEYIRNASLQIMSLNESMEYSNIGDNFRSPSSTNNNRQQEQNGTPLSRVAINLNTVFEEMNEDEPDIQVKDPPAPKRPKHRTTDSRYKSAVEKYAGKGKQKETTQGKGKGKGKGKGRGKANKDVTEKDLTSKVDDIVATQQLLANAYLQQMQQMQQYQHFLFSQQHSTSTTQPHTSMNFVSMSNISDTPTTERSIGAIGLSTQQGSVSYFTRRYGAPSTIHES